MLSAAKALDRHYIPARYPNGFEAGTPADYYTADDAEDAIGHAQQVIEFCQQHL
ncbi:MAG: HEPN domain-containing protein [Armatimonadota bacterium]